MAGWELTFDLLLLAGYSLVYSFGFTGQQLHEWLGCTLGLTLLIHLTLHWEWVVHASRRLLHPGSRRRLLWFVNLVLVVSMTLCITSGLALSESVLPALGLPAQGAGGTGLFWRRLHSATATITLIAVPVHAAMDWRWVLSVARRLRRRPALSKQP